MPWWGAIRSPAAGLCQESTPYMNALFTLALRDVGEGNAAPVLDRHVPEIGDVLLPALYFLH